MSILVDADTRLCVSGITGADLKKRIHQIVSADAVCQLSWRRKFLLAAAGLAALAWPLAVGIMNAPAGHAQSAGSPPLKFEVTSAKLNKSGSQRSPSMILPGGRFTATNNTVRALIHEGAFRLRGVLAAIPPCARWTRRIVDFHIERRFFYLLLHEENESAADS